MIHKKQYVDYLKLLNYISSHNIVVHCKTKDEAINKRKSTYATSEEDKKGM